MCMLEYLVFFRQKQNDIHSFKLIEYIKYNNLINIAKIVKGESANKLTTPKLKRQNAYKYYDKI